MSARACYTFRDNSGDYTVYKHTDGYPEGALQHIRDALAFAWTLPRFEADEFAAAFIRAGKERSGDFRLEPDGEKQPWQLHGDLGYRYVISAVGAHLMVEIHEAGGDLIFAGTLDAGQQKFPIPRSKAHA